MVIEDRLIKQKKKEEEERRVLEEKSSIKVQVIRTLIRVVLTTILYYSSLSNRLIGVVERYNGSPRPWSMEKRRQKEKRQKRGQKGRQEG